MVFLPIYEGSTVSLASTAIRETHERWRSTCHGTLRLVAAASKRITCQLLTRAICRGVHLFEALKELSLLRNTLFELIQLFHLLGRYDKFVLLFFFNLLNRLLLLLPTLYVHSPAILFVTLLLTDLA